MLIVISNPLALPGETAIVEQLFHNGLACFHLRKPQAGETEMRAWLQAIPAAWRNHIALHQHHKLAAEFGMHRLHFTEQHRDQTSLATLMRLKGKGHTLSTSVHRVETLLQLPPLFSYAFFAPVFNSISKQEYKGVAGDGFYLHDHQKPVRVIALGGIDEHNIHQTAAMNFDGAAVLGTIWSEPEKALERWVALRGRLTLPG